MQNPQAIMALDVGEKRIGVAIADPIARIAHPLTTLPHDSDVLDRIAEMIANQKVGTVVVGLPRGLDGQETAQTKVVREFNQTLQTKLGIMTTLQDEALTSVMAEEELKNSKKPYSKEDIDSYAAAHILQDYLTSSQLKEKV